MKKFKLEEDFLYEDLCVFALVSEIPAYRLSFLLNDDLKLKLKRSKKEKSYQYKNNSYSFSSFEYYHKQMDAFWWLVENRSSHRGDTDILGSNTLLRPLLSDFKVFDFFLCLEGADLHSFNHFLKTELKRLTYVRTFKELDVSSLKNIENLFIKE